MGVGRSRTEDILCFYNIVTSLIVFMLSFCTLYYLLFTYKYCLRFKIIKIKQDFIYFFNFYYKDFQSKHNKQIIPQFFFLWKGFNKTKLLMLYKQTE